MTSEANLIFRFAEVVHDAINLDLGCLNGIVKSQIQIRDLQNEGT